MRTEQVHRKDTQSRITPRDRIAPATGTQKEARKSLVIFVATVFLLSLPLYILMYASNQPVQEQQVLIFLLMWTPAIASLLVRLIRREGFRGIGFRVRSRGMLALIGLAIAFPIIVGFISYGGAWLSGLAEFRSLVPGGAAAADTGTAAGMNPATGLLLSIGKAATIVTLFGTVMVAGEEIGWRGYMTGVLMKSGLRAPYVVGGLIWATWHTPLILSGQYTSGPYPVISALTFAVLAVALHSLYSHWWARSGSLLPAIVAHSAWNSVIQHPFDGHTAGEGAWLWLGDSGILVVAVAAVLIALYIRFSSKTASPAAGEPAISARERA
jgi:hypothetical protein